MLEGNLVVRTSTKLLSVWKIERYISNLANTNLHVLTMRQLKPSRHTCSAWLTDGVTKKHDTCDWLLVYYDDACATEYVTLCVSATYVYIENTTSTRRAKTLSITRTWSQAWHWHQHENIKWNDKQRWVWRLTRDDGVNPSGHNYRVRLQNLLQAKILEVGCSRHNTWWHIGRTPASLFWFIGSTGT